jgi:hypothetical protein
MRPRLGRVAGPLAGRGHGSVFGASCQGGALTKLRDAPVDSPPRGSGAPAPYGALRAIDSSARPRSWRTFGPRRLRRQSEPALVTTFSDAVGATSAVSLLVDP